MVLLEKGAVSYGEDIFFDKSSNADNCWTVVPPSVFVPLCCAVLEFIPSLGHALSEIKNLYLRSEKRATVAAALMSFESCFMF